MNIALYPGSFDPVTYGHLDIIERSAKMADQLIVGVLRNKSKVPMFTVEERIEMLKEVTKTYSNVIITSFDGLLVEHAKKCKASFVIRGLRAITDFEYELQMSQTNRILYPDMDTIFLNTDLKYSYLSSSIVKEVALLGGNISEFVTPYVKELIDAKLKDGE